MPEAKSVMTERFKIMGLSGELKARLMKHPKLGLPKTVRGAPGKASGKKSRAGRKPSKKTRWNKKDEEELEERMENYGFTEAEVEELLCQGVKPWDDDAWVCSVVASSISAG